MKTSGDIGRRYRSEMIKFYDSMGGAFLDLLPRDEIKLGILRLGGGFLIKNQQK